jgi:DNA-binding transcriptional MerR regulator
MSLNEVNSLITLGFMAREIGILEGQLRKLANRGLVPHARVGSIRLFDRADAPAIRAACAEAGYLPRPASGC